MTKRQRFVVSSTIATCILISTTLVSSQWPHYLQWRYSLIALLFVSPAILTAWSLKDAWKGISRLTTIILPMMFGVGAGMFTFLLPDVITDFGIFSWSLQVGQYIGWFVRIIFWAIFAIAFYSLMLTENIFSVSAIRTIALARAANAVGFLLTLITGFFLYNATWSFLLPYYWNGLIIAGISFILLIQGLWSTKMDEKISQHVIMSSLILSLCIGQIAMILSFWPVGVAVASLVTTALLYVLLGLYQQQLLRRLFKKTMWEYVSVGVTVLAIVTLTTRWGG